jgi:nucleotide-binding universal stress UspA family protein
MRVLVATDGSAMAMNAMRTAARILSPEDRHLDLLCVMPPWNKRDESARKARYQEHLARETALILDRARETFRPDAEDIRRITDTGSPAAVIAARTADYDLTVIGAVGSGFKRETGLGPVASRVVEHALGPVEPCAAMRAFAFWLRSMAHPLRCARSAPLLNSAISLRGKSASCTLQRLHGFNWNSTETGPPPPKTSWKAAKPQALKRNSFAKVTKSSKARAGFFNTVAFWSTAALRKVILQARFWRRPNADNTTSWRWAPQAIAI